MLHVRARATIGLRSSIALRLVAAILLFSAVVTLALTALQLLLKYERGVAAIDNRLEEIRASYLASLGEGLWRLDEQQLRLELNGILHLPDIRSVEVRENSTRSSPMVVAAGQPGGEAIRSRDYPIAYRVRGVEKRIGVFHVEATLAGLYRDLENTALAVLIGQGAQTFLVSFFAIYILWRLLTRHLGIVARFVDDYDVHRPPPPLRLDRRPPRAPDELDKVVIAFNDLCATLQAAYDDLREREARIRRLVEANIIGIFFWKLDGTIVQANDALLDIVGYTREDLRSGKLRWTDITAPEHVGADDRATAELRETGTCHPYEKEYTHKDGHRVPVFLAGALLEGSRDEGVAFVLDLTDRRRAEAKARAYEVERKRAETLAELDRAKTAFFSNVSHEFRTPLTLALGPLESLLDRSSELPAEAREELAMAHRNCLRLMRLVTTLLDFSRIEAGRAQARYEPTDLARLTADVASCFRSACEQAHLRLLVDCPPLPEPVHVDPDMWEKIVLNLVSNAFKFTFDGEIEVKLRAVGDLCALSVRDTGVGIPEAELPRTFERFHRVESSRGRTLEGTGIGLALVQELAKLHGGSIHVKSAPGRGSTFTVAVPFGTAHLPAERIGTARELPSAQLWARPYVEEALRSLPGDERGAGRAALRPAAERSTERARAGQYARREARQRVLLADDNGDMREYVRRVLAEHCEVDAVADGQAALESARERRPALLLADVMMPRLDGFALLRELRTDPGLRTLPVVLLSARAGEESRVEGLEAGADDYLVKPFSPRELMARVTSQLELARIRGEVEHERAARAAAEEAYREIQRADREKSEFIAVLSHELRNPLAPIRTSIQLLRRCPSDSPLSARAKDIIEHQTEHLTRLVNDLLDLTRISRGKIEIHRTRVDLQEVVRTTCDDLHSLFEQRAVDLRFEPVLEPIWADADATRLSQVVGNLLHNAAKFTPAGGKVAVGIAAGRGRAEISVRDTGEGMEPDEVERMFEPFAQAEQGLARTQGGLGLGLALAKGLVELHGGSIRARSEGPGRGSEFVVSLPLGDESAALRATS